MLNELKERIQTEALGAIGNLRRAGVAVSMGVGKTVIALKHMFRNYHPKCKFLVVCPRVDIYESYIEDMEKFNLKFLNSFIVFTTYLSLTKQSLEFDVVYLDECHSLLPHHGEWLRKFKGKIIGLTGTPPRYKTSEKGVLVNTYCPIVYEYFTDEAVEDNILNDYKIIVHSLRLDATKNIKMTSKTGKIWFTSEVSIYNYWSKLCEESSGETLLKVRLMRMKALMKFDSKIRYAKQLFDSSIEKTIIFANSKEQADTLCIKSYYSGHPDGDKNLKDFKSDVITKLSCVAKLNEGVNILGLKTGIILHAYGNEKKASQRIGRLLRLNPNDCAVIHVLCYRGTVDEEWVKSALKDFNQQKITWS